jgi:hypothetical protein
MRLMAVRTVVDAGDDRAGIEGFSAAYETNRHCFARFGALDHERSHWAPQGEWLCSLTLPSMMAV